MGALMRRGAVVAGTVAVLLGPVAGVASAAGAAAGTRLGWLARIGPAASGGPAVEVPRTATLNAGGEALIESVSCTSAGHCSAGGRYTDSSHRSQAFVVSQA